ncbi:MAG: hypothetical protein FWD61_02135 [Phycisphaerales bacterium]|nr:hypothetical protein [Phycisphaerales bacterium]
MAATTGHEDFRCFLIGTIDDFAEERPRGECAVIAAAKSSRLSVVAETGVFFEGERDTGGGNGREDGDGGGGGGMNEQAEAKDGQSASRFHSWLPTGHAWVCREMVPAFSSATMKVMLCGPDGEPWLDNHQFWFVDDIVSSPMVVILRR